MKDEHEHKYYCEMLRISIRQANLDDTIHALRNGAAIDMYDLRLIPSEHSESAMKIAKILKMWNNPKTRKLAELLYF